MSTSNITDLKQKKLSLLREMIAGQSAKPNANRVIRRRASQVSQLSFAQQRLWFLNELIPNNPLYNVPAAFRIWGSVNRKVLERSLNEIVGRHESLRTRFERQEEGVVQVTEQSLSVPLRFEDLSHLPEQQREDAALQRAREDAREVFDLTRFPLLRATLLRLGEKEHWLLLTMHHIITDSWSMGVILRELAEVYEAFVTERPSPLPELVIQYSDFAQWQREWLQAEVLQEQLDYWKKHLEGIGVLQLPTDRSCPAVRTYEGKRQFMRVSDRVVRELEQLSRHQGVTLYMTLLAAFAVLLHRYTGEEDFSIGTPIANRNQSEIEGLVGFFVNTLVMRADLRGAPSFVELLKRVREITLGAYAHQDLPFEKLVEELHPERDLGQTPLFQVMFVLQNAPSPALQFSGLEMSNVELDFDTAKFDLTLSVVDWEQGLVGIEYSTELFEENTIKRLLEHWERMLEAIVARPENRIGELPLVKEEERDQILMEWNAMRRQYPREQCVQDLFEQQAQHTPDAVAVVYEGRQLTYRELNSRANQLAFYLRGMGVGPEVLVGICVQRSVEMVVGLLGILKAGGAYLPLDPNYPADRLEFMLRDAKVPFLLTHKGIVSSSVADGVSVVMLDDEWEEIAQCSEANPVVITSPENAAYVIYTSGSTGKPKGVPIPHANIVCLLLATKSRFDFSQRDVWTLFHSFAFDFSVWELWGALAYGGRLIIVSQDVSRSPEDFYEVLCSEGVTVLNQTPSAFSYLLQVDSLRQDSRLRLRWIIFGGEALEVGSLVNWWAQHGRSTALVNMYGITETTVHVTFRELNPDDIQAACRSPIGRALDNLKVYILDSQLEPVPAGFKGELYVTGDGLARGYINAAGLSAERFIPDRFASQPGQRLYRTGDLARMRADGEIEYLGRQDNQVKIRGFRVELGEIETALREHPAVQDAIVQTRISESGEKRLIAWVVPDQIRALPILQMMRFEREGHLEEQHYELPNKRIIFHHRKNETEFSYKEIFEDRAYIKHGIQVPEGAYVFDVGANIGLFSLFVGWSFEPARIYAFEPIPAIFKILERNVSLYGFNAKVFNCGLGREPKRESFTYYPDLSILSGCHGDAQGEREVVKSFILHQLDENPQLASISSDELNELVSDRLSSESFICSIKTLSQIIFEEQIERIDLLKIDVEKSELGVLEGIEEPDWKKIQQVVAEAHDKDGVLANVIGLLSSHGFECAVEQDDSLSETGLYMVYARRPLKAIPTRHFHDGKENLSAVWTSKRQLICSLKECLEAKLPAYMVPSGFVVMEKFPLTANGKIDRAALPWEEENRPELTQQFQPPRTAIEETLVGLWSEILGPTWIGIEDNWFDLGGHSLLATQLISRVRTTFQIDLPVRSLFEAPTVRRLGERVEAALNSPKIWMLEPIARMERGVPTPLSFAQQRLWFLDELVPNNPFCIVPAALHIQGPLNREVLEASLNEVVSRHDSLRTHFVRHEDAPLQVVDDFTLVPLDFEDLSQLPQQQREAEALRIARADAREVFDLSRRPLLRTTLLKLGDQDHWLLLTMHHIVTDGWSVGIILRELAVIYKSFLAERQSPLPELVIQYSDFARWQRQWMQGEVLQEQLDYWKKQLEGVSPLQLPTDKPRPAVRTYAGALLSWEIDAALVKQLEALNRREGVTLYMTLLAALNVLLSRYSNQQDIAVGTPIANRNRAEIEDLVGFFVNTLVMRTDVNGNPSFSELLKRVREVTLAAYTHQDLPFEKLVEELHPERDLSQTPLFQTVFAMQNFPLPSVSAAGLRFEPLEFDTATAKFDLTLFIMPVKGGGLLGSIEYSTELFEHSTIERLVNHLQNLLKGIVDDSQRRIGDLPLLSEQERRLILVDWNLTARDYRPDCCVHELFEQQVERTPQAMAVIYEGEQLSYEELNRKANQLAHYLRERGVGPEVLVGLCVDRSLEMVVGLLGILKGGGAYVPLDPNYPRERLEFMLRDCGARVLLTQSHLQQQRPDDSAQIVCLDEDWRLIAAASDANPKNITLPGSLAYVVYTSGSTGTPKGVGIHHAGLVNLVYCHNTSYQVMPQDRASHFSALGFDGTGWEIWPYLAAGACVQVMDEQTRTSVEGVHEFITRNQITRAFLPPVLSEALLERSWPKDTALRTLLTGGDRAVLYPPQGLPFEYWNHYGPTEATVTATRAKLDAQASLESPPAIGHPLDNFRVFVLDSNLKPVPALVAGELYIAGVGLARGYLDAALTAEKFIPAPYTDEPGARMYGTGDIARYRPDGLLEFLGRNDHQVKLRGFRIELGEIEARLKAHTAVRNAIAVAHGEAPDTMIVAYVVPINSSQPVEPAELRGFLAEMLPQYMIPAAFILIDKIPLTSNGKVSTAELPPPESVVPASEVPTPLEQELADIWSSVLEIETVSIHDNFFGIGGHSLLASLVILRIQEVFGITVPVRTVFEAPTIAELSVALGQMVAESADNLTETAGASQD